MSAKDRQLDTWPRRLRAADAAAPRAAATCLSTHGRSAAACMIGIAIVLVGDPRAADARPAATAAQAAGTPWRFVAFEPEGGSREGGIGMVLSGDGQGIVIDRAVPGGPAARAGLSAGDRIQAIDGQPVGPGASVSEISGKIRGLVGTRVKLLVLTPGASPRIVEVERAPLKALFPQRAARPLVVGAELALLAVTDRHHVGVRFEAAEAATAPLRYEWRLGPRRGPLGDGSEVRQGAGELRLIDGRGLIQVDTLRLELEAWPARGAAIVARSNIPVAVVPAGRWQELDPAAQALVEPRGVPQPMLPTWPEGPCSLWLTLRTDGGPLAQHRVTAHLRRDEGDATPAAPAVVTDRAGRAMLRLPAGKWAVTALEPSLFGGQPDAAYAAVLRSPTSAVECRAGGSAELMLDLVPAPSLASPTLPASAQQHALVGKVLPPIPVRAWLGPTAGPPADGLALVMILWATWCGPCKRVLPVIQEAGARLAGEGARVVLVSVDRDEAALRDAADDMLPGTPPLAWADGGLLDTVGASGIPTVIIADRSGVVRVVHTGAGASVEAWVQTIRPLLAAPTAGKTGGHEKGEAPPKRGR